MKKHGFFLLLLMGLIYVYYSYETKATSHSEAFTKLMNIVTMDTDIQLEQWQLIAKETIANEFEQTVAKLQKEQSDFTWESPRYTEDVVHVEAVKYAPDESHVEKIVLHSYLHHEKPETLLTYEITGSMWNEQIKSDAVLLFSTRTTDLFSESPAVFTCITGNLNDTMNNIVLKDEARAIMHQFHADFVEEMQEETFVSLSAYTTLWHSSLLTNRKKMNLQIALRQQHIDDSITVMIGTPILMTEY